MKVYNNSEVISSNNLDLDDQTVGGRDATHCLNYICISKQTLMTVAFQRLLNLCPACLFVFFHPTQSILLQGTTVLPK